MRMQRLALALLGVVAGGVRATGQVATLVVPDAPSCAKCTIAVRPVVGLGAVDGPGSLSNVPFALTVDGRGRYWVTQEAEMPMVFDVTGRFVQSVGRKGEGPGEFSRPWSLMPVADSVLVFDFTRATMIDHDLRPGRTITVPPGLRAGALFAWPTLAFLTNTASGRRNEPRQPLARVRFSPTATEVLGAFGPGRGDADPMYPQFQILGNVRGDHAWSADATRYRLSQWDAAGTLERSLERKPEWFVNPADGSAKSMAQPHVRAIREDSAGLLWIFTSTSRPGWRAALPKMGPGVTEIASRQIMYEKLYRTTVEVIDPRTARVVAQRVLDEWIVAALPDNRAAAYSVDENGTPRISILQLSLQGR